LTIYKSLSLVHIQPYFAKMQQKLRKYVEHKITIVIDIADVFLVKVDARDDQGKYLQATTKKILGCCA
jgi:hypothetical protein